jgi:hypothetical protein
VVETHPPPQTSDHRVQEVERRQAPRVVLARVAGEHGVVEAPAVETDHQPRRAQYGSQLARTLLAEGLEAPLLQVADHRERDPHPVRLVPAADLRGRAQGLDVEQDGSTGGLRGDRRGSLRSVLRLDPPARFSNKG